MKVIYDPETDILDMILREGEIVESDEEKPGIILDYDAQGNIISIEQSHIYTFNVTGIFLLDVYENNLYAQEIHVVNINNVLGFETKKGSIYGTVVSIEDTTLEEISGADTH